MSLITPDFGLIFWMTLIFAVVFLILAKWGFPMITNMVDKRADKINASLRKAEEADKALAEMSQRQVRMLEEAKAQQAKILREASESGEKIIAQAKEKASAEAEIILSETRTQIAAEKESALRDIRSQVASLSVQVAQRILRSELGKESSQSSYIDALISETESKTREHPNT